MQELIKIKQVGQLETVSARDLHNFLESKQDFSEWIKNRIEKFGFNEGEDFSIILGESTGGRPTKEYYCRIEMAKELSMLESNEKGQIARKYFIECEKQLKKVFEIPQTFSQALLLAAKQAEIIENQAKTIEDQRPKVEFFDQVAECKTAIDMRKAAAVLNVKKYGRNNLFEFLRNNEIFDGDNIPFRKYQDLGYFRVIEQKFNNKHGEPMINFKTLVFQKGLDFIRKKLESHISGANK